MIHYSCDRCRRAIHQDELRFTVSIEIQVALESDGLLLDNAEEGLMEELDEALLQFDEEDREEIRKYAYQRRQYDVCADCHRDYLDNPLAVEASAKVGFSQN